jgi:hypothetical protein
MDKLAIFTRFLLLNPFNQQKAISFIHRVNAREKYWQVVPKKMILAVPYVSEIPNGTYSSTSIIEDIFSEKKPPDRFVQFMIKSVKKFDDLFFYVEDGPLGFSPVFSIILGSEKNIQLIKFKKSFISKEFFDQIIIELYSEKSKDKHKLFCLPIIEELAYYNY